MHVRCSDTNLTVELSTVDPFTGRIYTSGHSDNCGVQGNGSHVTVLLLKYPELDKMTSDAPCGIYVAYSVDNNNA